jgi:hypothetical protein
MLPNGVTRRGAMPLQEALTANSVGLSGRGCSCTYIPGYATINSLVRITPGLCIRGEDLWDD